MKDLGITKGEWTTTKVYYAGEKISIRKNNRNDIVWAICQDIESNIDMEQLANADLIADAGNTAQKCGLLPSELLEQRDELLKALQAVVLQNGMIPHNWDYREKNYMPEVIAVIKKDTL